MHTLSVISGNSPILISLPHNGTGIPSDILNLMYPYAREVQDTDWYLDKLYSFTHTNNFTVLSPKFSRYVIDLNRASDNSSLYPGSNNTELCPTSQFDNKPLYLDQNFPTLADINKRTHQYWHPYHQALQSELERLKQLHPVVVLFDAHSIASRVPRFFEGELPDFNFGTNDGKSCSDDLLHKIKHDLELDGYSSVYNGRFKGGFITRHYGNPAQGIHSIQLELSQATYMNEDNLCWEAAKADNVIPYLQQLIEIINKWIETQ